MAAHIEYLTVYNAHTGILLRVPKPLRFHTLGEFKNYLYENFTNYIIGSADNIFLLTAFGIKLNFAMINSINDVYMFDKRLFVEGNDAIFEKYLQLSQHHPNEMLRPKPYEPSTTIDDEIAQIVSTLKVCDGWSRALVQDSLQINDRIDHYVKQTNAIFMSLSVIFEFTTNYIRDIKKYFENHQNHVQLLSMKSLHDSWKSHYNDLKKFPDISLRLSPNSHLRLSNYLDSGELAASAAYIGKFLPAVVEKFNGFSREVARVNKLQLDIDLNIEHLRKESISRFKDTEKSKSAFLGEIESLSKEILADSEALNSNNAKQIFPRQTERAKALFSEVQHRYKLLRSLYDFKCMLGRSSIVIFEKMGSLQKTMVQIRSEIKTLTSEKLEEISNFKDFPIEGNIDSKTIARIQIAEDHLSMTIDFPLLFGIIMIEKRRQYEWHNFFSKGVVHNTSEQLTMIIKHELDFQKLWIRKYGRLVKLITLHNMFRIQLPSIDLSLVNGKIQNREDSILAALGDVDIHREDIANYILIINSQKLATTAETLTKNFDSLTVTTENLKHITKIIATLSSFASPNNLKMKIEKEANSMVSNVENDTDLNIINGLRSRIRCLESLLHQRQYQELLSWPVLKNSGGRSPDNRQSMLLLAPSHNGTTKSTSESFKHRRSSSSRSQQVDNSSSKILDASVTIDKHLDNIRLRRENSELVSTNGLLVRENESLQNQLTALKKQLEEKCTESESMRANFEEKFAITQATIEELGNRHEEEFHKFKRAKLEEISELQRLKDVEFRDLQHRKDVELQDIQKKRDQELHNFNRNKAEELQDLKKKKDEELSEIKRSRDVELTKFAAENSDLKAQIADLKVSLQNTHNEHDRENELDLEISNLSAELSDLKILNSELTSTLSSLEEKLSSEREVLDHMITDRESKIKEQELKIKDLTDDLEGKTRDLKRMVDAEKQTLSWSSLLDALNKHSITLMFYIEQLVMRNLEFFKEFCFVLESMGLLLVSDEENGKHELKIARVKGLRTRKGIESLDEKALKGRTTPHSQSYVEIAQMANWTEVLLEKLARLKEDVYKQLPSEDQRDHLTFVAEQLEEIFKEDFEDSSDMSAFSKFMKAISFTENVQLQHHNSDVEAVNQKFFLNGISKRFLDVEAFAKKLTKENKQKAHELAKSIELCNSKITVNNFAIGDLVLFLPIRIEDAGDQTEVPWTAFNIDSPNYLLDLLINHVNPNQEWIVNRVRNITQHEVTQEAVDDRTKNPFALSVGSLWFMIYTT